MDISQKFDTFSLAFTTEEYKESISDKFPNEVNSFGKRAFFQEPFPGIIENISSQICQKFNIKPLKTSVTIYTEEWKKSNKNSLVLEKSSKKVTHRVIVSTIDELAEMSFMSRNLSMKINNWTCYLFPMMSSSLLEMKFSNKSQYVIPPKKGMRSIRKTKKLEDRSIIVFDYISDISDIFKNLKSSIKEEDESVEEALKSLQ